MNPISRLALTEPARHCSSGLQAAECGRGDHVAPQHDIDVVGHLTVFQWKGVGVVPERRRRIAMAQPVLGPEELTPADQECGDGVA